MKSIVKLVGISSCCIALGAAAANADPVPLADAELDRVAAGACMAGPGAQYCNDTPCCLIFPRPPLRRFQLISLEPITFGQPPEFRRIAPIAPLPLF